MKHTITYDEVKAGVFQPFEHHIASSVGKGSDKRLIASIRLQPQHIRLRVIDHGRLVYEGETLENAVEAYNRAP